MLFKHNTSINKVHLSVSTIVSRKFSVMAKITTEAAAGQTGDPSIDSPVLQQHRIFNDLYLFCIFIQRLRKIKMMAANIPTKLAIRLTSAQEPRYPTSGLLRIFDFFNLRCWGRDDHLSAFLNFQLFAVFLYFCGAGLASDPEETAADLASEDVFPEELAFPSTFDDPPGFPAFFAESGRVAAPEKVIVKWVSSLSFKVSDGN